MNLFDQIENGNVNQSNDDLNCDEPPLTSQDLDQNLII